MGKTIRETAMVPWFTERDPPEPMQMPRDPWMPRPAGEMKPKPRRYKGSKAAKKASRRKP